MTVLGDNDGELAVMLVSMDDGKTLECLDWRTARERVAAFLEPASGTSSEGWAERRAEDLLCALLTGASALPSTRSQPPTEGTE